MCIRDRLKLWPVQVFGEKPLYPPAAPRTDAPLAPVQAEQLDEEQLRREQKLLLDYARMAVTEENVDIQMCIRDRVDPPASRDGGQLRLLFLYLSGEGVGALACLADGGDSAPAPKRPRRAGKAAGRAVFRRTAERRHPHR